ncbi:hypothetical protein N7471_002233 [Penicillium samsonianum]|uniref:uncharacterized protein n=1 Tax=Penicillium samsonianum TaxID=1882272 RepID=UPI00254986FD|nr:uncharacterized protein N7471_002233 [Penicillium samsonianum]KAJ6142780.1 hypothetical protein N7471_002233 [Penicillium samsonianum]
MSTGVPRDARPYESSRLLLCIVPLPLWRYPIRWVACNKIYNGMIKESGDGHVEPFTARCMPYGGWIVIER